MKRQSCHSLRTAESVSIITMQLLSPQTGLGFYIFFLERHHMTGATVTDIQMKRNSCQQLWAPQSWTSANSYRVYIQGIFPPQSQLLPNDHNFQPLPFMLLNPSLQLPALLVFTQPQHHNLINPNQSTRCILSLSSPRSSRQPRPQPPACLRTAIPSSPPTVRRLPLLMPPTATLTAPLAPTPPARHFPWPPPRTPLSADVPKTIPPIPPP